MALDTGNAIQSGLATYGQVKNLQYADEAMKNRREDRKISLKDAAVNRERSTQVHKAKMSALQDQKQQQQAMMFLGRQIAAKRAGLKPEFSDDELKAVKDNKLLNMDFLLSDEVGQALETAKGVREGAIPVQSPEAAVALNVMAPEVQKGSPGQKSLRAILPAPDGDSLLFELDVDGKAAPMTVGRDANPDAPLMQVPMDSVIGRVTAVEQMRNMLSSEKGQTYLEELYYQMGGKKPTLPTGSSPLAKLQNERQQLLESGIPESDPRIKQYDDKIVKETTKSSGVSVNVGGEKKEKEVLAETRVKRFDKLAQDAEIAYSQNEQLEIAKNIDVSTGGLAPLKTMASRFTAALGVDPETVGLDDASNAEAFSGIMSSIVLDKMAAQKGPQTDKDRAHIEKTVAGLSGSPLANKFLISSAIAVNNRKIEQQEFYEDYLDEHDTLKGANKAWREFKQSMPMVSQTVKDPGTGLPVFYYEYRERLREANPGVSDDLIASKWRSLQSLKGQ